MQPFKVFSAAFRRLRDGRSASLATRLGERPTTTGLDIELVERPLNDITQQVMRASTQRPAAPRNAPVRDRAR